MAEFQVAPGRYLISANMGEGYEQYNDPATTAAIIEFNYRWLNKQWDKEMEHYVPTWNFDLSLSNMDRDIDEQRKTARLEYLWLIGNKGLVRRILNG